MKKEYNAWTNAIPRNHEIWTKLMIMFQPNQICAIVFDKKQKTTNKQKCVKSFRFCHAQFIYEWNAKFKFSKTTDKTDRVLYAFAKLDTGLFGLVWVFHKLLLCLPNIYKKWSHNSDKIYGQKKPLDSALNCVENTL